MFSVEKSDYIEEMERKGDRQREQSVNSEIENIEDIEYRKNC